MACATFDFPINKNYTSLLPKKKNFENSFTAIQSVCPLRFLRTAAVSMDAGCFLHDKAAMLRDMIKTHPVTQAWSVSSSMSLFKENLLLHSSPCSHNVLLFKALMSNFLFLQSMNKVKYNQESTHHFIVLHDMFFDG